MTARLPPKNLCVFNRINAAELAVQVVPRLRVDMRNDADDVGNSCHRRSRCRNEDRQLWSTALAVKAAHPANHWPRSFPTMTNKAEFGAQSSAIGTLVLIGYAGSLSHSVQRTDGQKWIHR
jgi:hypothetical protein